jgi:uncharacterized protein (TIGR00369 family)
MSIWKTPLTVEDLNKRAQGNMAAHLGIEFLEVGDNYIKARMPVDHRTKQPIGIMNGGASCALAESVGSAAANYCVDLTKQYCVGLDINTNHVRSAREGYVIATATPFHLGSKTQVWSINIENEQGELISVNRLTMMVLDRSG